MTLKKLMKLTALSFCLVALFACFVAACVLFLVLEDFSRELPVLESARYKPRLTTKLYDCQGVLISELKGEKNRREVVPISRIPVHTQRAFVSVEDERFYQHYGIDVRAVARAMVRNLKAGKIVEGGSTITQQLAKNRFLKSERTWTRRMKDTILAIRFERNYTKDEILAQYLNEIFFGGQIYGIASAAQYYFGKRVEDLSLAESAVLAGMLPAPNRYSPLRKNKAWKQRQRIVLQKMWKQGYITREQAVSAYMDELHVVGRLEHVQRAPYFADLVRRRLVALFGAKKAFNGGLRVFTSLDLTTQALAERVFDDAAIFKRYSAKDYPKMQGAMIVLNPLDGTVRALIGGRDYRQSQFDRCTQARRQPGSAFKPFVYCTAFKQGISPNVILTDEPVRYLMPNTDEYWEPRNYTERFHGPVILSKALEHSYNIVAIKLLDQVGIEQVINLSKRLGIESPLEPDLSLALGSSEVSLLEMASAYGTFANQGIRVTPRAILRVEDGDGTLLYENDTQEYEALDERIAFLTTKVLEGVVTRGTGVRSRVPGFEIAGKTGTTNDFADAWYMAYTPDLVVGAYFGFDDRKSLGEGMSGPKVAVPVVGGFLREHLKTATPQRFVRPPGVETIKVCCDTGFLALSGCRSVALPFLKGKAPDSYCHLHQPIDFSVSSLRKREFTGHRAPKGSLAPSVVRRMPMPSSSPAFEGPSPMAVYEALPAAVTSRRPAPSSPDVAMPSSPPPDSKPVDVGDLGNYDLSDGGAPAMNLGPALDLSLGN